MLPYFFKQLAAECPEEDRMQLEEKLLERVGELENPTDENTAKTARMLSTFTKKGTDNYLLAGIVYKMMQGGK